ncbi:MAG TPA: hypothetical protein VFD13_03135, partial [Candidatus Kapabacteria bacterium]|nr:hypothetical protein [Candidatus Kapabacteria bacterium]
DQTNASVPVNTTLDVDGGISFRPLGTGASPATTSVTSSPQTITVGDASYILLTASSAQTGLLFSTAGGAASQGQILIVSVANGSSTISLGTTNMHIPLAGVTLSANQAATFIFDGTSWIMTSYSNNS